MKKFVFILFLLFGCFVTFFATKASAQEKFGINLEGDCMRGVGSGCFDVEKLLFPDSPIDGINKRRSVMTLTQDFVYGAMVAVGTVLVIVIIYCGLMYIFSANGGGGDVSKYRKGLTDAAIGALLVWGAYAIIRLIQYMAKG